MCPFVTGVPDNLDPCRRQSNTRPSARPPDHKYLRHETLLPDRLFLDSISHKIPHKRPNDQVSPQVMPSRFVGLETFPLSASARWWLLILPLFTRFRIWFDFGLIVLILSVPSLDLHLALLGHLWPPFAIPLAFPLISQFGLEAWLAWLSFAGSYHFRLAWSDL